MPLVCRIHEVYVLTGKKVNKTAKTVANLLFPLIHFLPMFLFEQRFHQN